MRFPAGLRRGFGAGKFCRGERARAVEGESNGSFNLICFWFFLALHGNRYRLMKYPGP
jgi:hypothetical protein